MDSARECAWAASCMICVFADGVLRIVDCGIAVESTVRGAPACVGCGVLDVFLFPCSCTVQSSGGAATVLALTETDHSSSDRQLGNRRL